jgi:hypothetical protein
VKIVFSRKGFDTGSGGGASPIVDGKPISLPIPDTKGIARTTYGDLGLGEHASKASKGAYGADSLCHHDPMLTGDGRCLFGQVGAAQTHLANNGVGVGDTFLFFGLFADEDGERHHRIFGYLRIAAVHWLAEGTPDHLEGSSHPHVLGMHGSNDTIYEGEGRQARFASEALRLTVPGGPLTLWQRPAWLKPGGLSYHDRPDRWLPGGRLRSVARGQEFVADVGRRKAPREWLERVMAEIQS